MKTAAIYARRAAKGLGEECGIGSQIAAPKLYGSARGYEVPETWVFGDEGHSGATLARPGLGQLRGLAAEGRIEALLVCSPDRLSRSCAHYLLLLEEMARSGVEVVFLSDPLATAPQGPFRPAGPIAV